MSEELFFAYTCVPMCMGGRRGRERRREHRRVRDERNPLDVFLTQSWPASRMHKGITKSTKSPESLQPRKICLFLL